MDWKKSSHAEKKAYLEKQLAEIQTTKALIARFEQLTLKYLKVVAGTSQKR